jgi:hypothetical protein
MEERLTNSRDSIWYHSAILDLFRPFVAKRRSAETHLKTFASTGSTAQAVFDASVAQLKRLILVYRTEHELTHRCITWHTGMVYLANAILKAGGGAAAADAPDDRRFYFLLCIYGYQNLYAGFRVAATVAQGLLSMAIRDGALPSSEARVLLEELYKNGKHHAVLGNVRSTFIVDQELALTNSEEAQVETLAEKFEELALLDELTMEPELLIGAEPVEADEDDFAENPIPTIE